MTATVVIYHYGHPVTVLMRHPRNSAFGSFPGHVHMTHPSGRITVRVVIEGVSQLHTADPVNVLSR